MKKQDATVFDAQALNDLRILVARGEGQHLEFKRRASSDEKIGRELVAFANASGGTLLVGVGDDGTIPGVKYPEDESLVVQQAIASVRPAMTVSETFIPVDNNRTVLQYVVEVSHRRPHFTEDAQGVKEYFVRAGDKSIRASRELREIIRRRQHARDIRFHYGDHERFLMQYLEANKTITLNEFVAASGLKKFHASRKLVLLVLANVLRIMPHQKGDQYTLAFTKF